MLAMLCVLPIILVDFEVPPKSWCNMTGTFKPPGRILLFLSIPESLFSPLSFLQPETIQEIKISRTLNLENRLFASVVKATNYEIYTPPPLAL